MRPLLPMLDMLLRGIGLLQGGAGYRVQGFVDRNLGSSPSLLEQ